MRYIDDLVLALLISLLSRSLMLVYYVSRDLHIEVSLVLSACFLSQLKRLYK